MFAFDEVEAMNEECFGVKVQISAKVTTIKYDSTVYSGEGGGIIKWTLILLEERIRLIPLIGINTSSKKVRVVPATYLYFYCEIIFWQKFLTASGASLTKNGE